MALQVREDGYAASVIPQEGKMTILLRALLGLLKNWRAILALAGLVVGTGFAAKLFLQEVHKSILSHWFLLALVCMVILVREYLRGYFNIKHIRTHGEMGRKKRNEDI